MAYEVQNFQEDVLEASRIAPVVVDFWAPWCGPCRVLGPVLEELASENGATWKLVKINTDEHPDVSMQYGVRGIPAVKMFVDGKVTDEFTGALPRHAVVQWLAGAVPSGARVLVEEARKALDSGHIEEARAKLEDALVEDPTNADASLLLAQTVVFENPGRARELVESVEIVDPVLTQVADGITIIARLLEMTPPYRNLPDGAGQPLYVDAINALRKRDLKGALDAFIGVIANDRYYDEDGARKACLALFAMLGEKHAITQVYRPRFNMALY